MPEPDVAAEPLDRLDRLLLGVLDDELSELAHRLLRIVGHTQSPSGISGEVSPCVTTPVQGVAG